MERRSKENPFPAKAVEQLAARVAAGEVVFFVGSGHSIDTEGNTASKMVRRLMTRFESMKNRSNYGKLRANLFKTFELDEKKDLIADTNVDKLAAQYYKINDWVTNAFGELTRAGKKPDPKRGKKLFLEAQGFSSEEIMAGKPLDKDINDVRVSYVDRLLDRHFVLARLAREGLCPTLITTNFDLQVEGGYRLTGFDYEECERYGLPRTEYDYFVPIACFTDFLRQGGKHRTAMVVKIHGCAREYRKGDASYLDSLVFTYREIQNWRKDAWSRDMLTTLLRTRTVMFCGYSTADPVIHDTFRTVYEEIAAHAPPNGRPADAPAFYSGLANKNEFDAIEILRAASKAAGVAEPPLADHPNYLRFFLRAEPSFPNFDQMMVWLAHRVTRLIQRQALGRELRRAAAHLGIPGRESHCEQIETDFDNLCESELKTAETWHKDSPPSQCVRMTNWTWSFHAGLLREWAFAEANLRSHGFGIEREQLRATPWYFPFTGNSLWTAWGIVVELAFRKAAAHWRGAPASWLDDSPWCLAGAGRDPMMLFSKGNESPTPYAFTIRAGSPRLNSAAAGVVCRVQETLHLRSGEIWPREQANILWEMAANVCPGELEHLAPRFKEADDKRSRAVGSA